MTTETIERPRTSDPGTGGGGWRVIVRNDDHNTFEHVAATLARVIPGLSYDNGMAFANTIHNTGQAIEKIELDMERDRFMNAVDAKAYGLIDEVLDKRAGETVKSA